MGEIWENVAFSFPHIPIKPPTFPFPWNSHGNVDASLYQRLGLKLNLKLSLINVALSTIRSFDFEIKHHIRNLLWCSGSANHSSICFSNLIWIIPSNSGNSFLFKKLGYCRKSAHLTSLYRTVQKVFDMSNRLGQDQKCDPC